MYRIIYNALFDSEKNLKFSLVKCDGLEPRNWHHMFTVSRLCHTMQSTSHQQTMRNHPSTRRRSNSKQFSSGQTLQWLLQFLQMGLEINIISQPAFLSHRFSARCFPWSKKTKRCSRSQTWICHSSMRPCGNPSRISNPHSWYPEPGFLWRQGPENSYQTCKKKPSLTKGISWHPGYTKKDDTAPNRMDIEIKCKSSIDG